MLNKSKSEQGQAIVIIAMVIVGLVGMTALAVDGGYAFVDRRNAQSAADTGVFSAALAKIRGNDWYYAGLTLASANGYDNADPNQTVEIYNPPISGPYTGNSEYIQMIIESRVNTFFAPVIGVDQLSNKVEAVSRAKPPEIKQMVGGNAMVSLAPTECQAFYLHGTADTYVTGGGIFVNSDGDECNNINNGAFEQQGTATLTAPDGGVSSVGNWVVQDPTLLNPYPPVEGAIQLDYPPFIMPVPDCETTDSTKSGSTLTPGNLDASWLRDDVFLEPGTYCIYGDLVLNASNTLEGHDITLYFVDGGLHINGKGEFFLDAPDSGDLAGLLIFLPMDNDEIVILNGNSTSEFEGSILAPASEIQINGTGNVNGYNSQIVGYTIDLIGTADIYIHYDDSTNYDATIPSKIELAQ